MSKRILVAPLNWGLGHATRCIPIINALITHGFTPVIASDGAALILLKKEFPNLEALELPPYDVTYAKKGKHFKFKILKDSPKLLNAIKAEKKATKHLLAKHKIDGIISDNRLGVYSKVVPSVFITHQLNVLSGSTTWISTKIHEKFIQKFDVCWVPDVKEKPNLSGKLGHTKSANINTEYIGPLSRFKAANSPMIYDVMVLLSGPEPQRSILEEKLLNHFKAYSGHVLFVRGVLEAQQTKDVFNRLTVYNFMTSKLLEQSINQSRLVLSRSGYTTVMDLAKLNKKAFFIPTPGQFEQEYLAKRLNKLNLVGSCQQDDFKLALIETALTDYKGLTGFNFNTDFKRLFGLFEGK